MVKKKHINEFELIISLLGFRAFSVVKRPEH